MFLYWGVFLCFMGLCSLVWSFVFLGINMGALLVFDFFKVNLMSGEMYILLDWMSLMFSGVVLIISGCVVIYSTSYMLEEKNKIGFCILVLLFVLSMILMIFMPNMWAIMLGWDGLGMVSYALVIFYQSETSSNAGMITVLSNRVGDVGLLMSLVFLVCCGSWGILYIVEGQFTYMIVMIVIVLGAITKSAQIPFSAWLPAAMAAPTPVSSLVHSSTLVTAGVYLLIRFGELFGGGEISGVLLVLSILTMVMAGIGAMLEMDMKKIIALSTLSQLGVMMMTLSVGLSMLAFFHLVTHAVFKAMLFLCAGVLIHGLGGLQDVRLMGGSMKMSPYIMMMIMLGSLSLMGFPFLSGFYSKDLLLESFYMLGESYSLVLLLGLGTIMTVLYSFRLVYYIIYGGMHMTVLVSYNESKYMNYPILVMGILVVFFGSGFYWLGLGDYVIINLLLGVSVLNLGFIIFGLWSFICMMMFLWNSGYLAYWTYFIGGMWFLPNITSNSMLMKFQLYRGFQMVMDQGWIEVLGGGGLYEEMTMKSVFMVDTVIGIKNFLFMFVMVLLLFLMV